MAITTTIIPTKVQVDNSTIDFSSSETLEVKDSGITSAKIADATIQTADIADSAITTEKIASNAVTTDKITDGTIQTADIADSAITNAKIANDAVTTDKIADYAITDSKVLSHYTLSDNVLTSDTSLKTVDKSISAYTKMKEYTIYGLIDSNVTLRIEYHTDTYDSSVKCVSRIYKNGVAVGTEHSSASSSVWSEDIGGWNNNDKIQIYAYCDPSGTANTLVNNVYLKGNTNTGKIHMVGGNV